MPTSTVLWMMLLMLLHANHGTGTHWTFVNCTSVSGGMLQKPTCRPLQQQLQDPVIMPELSWSVLIQASVQCTGGVTMNCLIVTRQLTAIAAVYTNSEQIKLWECVLTTPATISQNHLFGVLLCCFWKNFIMNPPY